VACVKQLYALIFPVCLFALWFLSGWQIRKQQVT